MPRNGRLLQLDLLSKNNAYTGEHAYNKAWYVPNPKHPLSDITAEVKRTIRRPKPKDE